MCYMTAFAAEGAKVAVHLSLSLLLGQLAILSKFGGEVGFVFVAGKADRQLSGVVGAGVVSPVIRLAVRLQGFVALSDLSAFTGTGGIPTADLRMTFPIASVDGWDKGTKSVEVVQFSNSCDFVLDATGKSIVELAVEGSIAPIDFGGELLKADNVFSNFLVIMHFECSSSFSASASMLKGQKLVQSSETSSS